MKKCHPYKGTHNYGITRVGVHTFAVRYKRLFKTISVASVDPQPRRTNRSPSSTFLFPHKEHDDEDDTDSRRFSEQISNSKQDNGAIVFGLGIAGSTNSML